MGWVTGIAVYFVVWWTALFMVLPFYVQRDEQPERGNDAGAPRQSNLKKKFLINSIFSFLIWLLIYWLVHIQLIDFRAIVDPV